MKDFPEMPKWTWMCAWLDFNGETNPKALVFTWPQSLIFECPHGCVQWFILHEFLIVIICIFMEMIGASPYSWAICQTDIRHKSCPTSCRTFEPSVDFWPYPWPRMEISNLTLKKRERKKRTGRLFKRSFSYLGLEMCKRKRKKVKKKEKK